jgi:T5SS/PEP-CTERM-associated repeat protein
MLIFISRCRLSRWTVFAAAMLAALMTSRAPAANRYWVAGGNGDFHSTTNWSASQDIKGPASVPGVGDNANFLLSGSYNVTFSGNATSDVLRVEDGSVDFFSNAFINRTYNLSDDLVVRNNGTLTIGIGTLGSMVVNVGDEIDIGTATDSGTVVVTGSSARLDAPGIGSGTHSVGYYSQLTYQNGAGGTIADTLDVGVSSSAATLGNLDVSSGAELTLGQLRVGTGSAGHGFAVVDGAGSTLVQSGASTLTIGGSSPGGGGVYVNNRGVFSTGTGDTTLGVSGALYIGQSGLGTFNANGSVTVDGGTISVGAGGQASRGSAIHLGAGESLTAMNDARIDFHLATNLSDGTDWNIQSGADLTSIVLGIGRTAGVTTDVVVDGAGSSLSATAGPSYWGSPGNANISIRNDASASLGELRLSTFDTAGGSSHVNVETGADLTLADLRMADAGGAANTATLTVDGAGSTVTQTGASILSVGHSSQGAATINVQDAARFITGTGGLTVRKTGTINVLNRSQFFANGDVTVDGGTINVDEGSSFIMSQFKALALLDGAQFNIPAGTFRFPQSTSIQSGADLFLGESLNLAMATAIVVDGAGSTATFSGPSNTNSGRIDAAAGGQVEFTGPLTNAASGLIAGGDATLRFAGGLANSGMMSFTGGATEVFGDVVNDSGGMILVSEGGMLTFHDNVTMNDGTNIQVARYAGPIIEWVKFFGSYNGGTTGEGAAYIEGFHQPGRSPAAVSFGGDVFYGDGSRLEIELGGGSPGTQFDQVNIAGVASLDGTLDVTLIDGFAPREIGQEFTVMTYADHIGQFDTVNQSRNPILPGLGWSVSYMPTSVVLTTTPLLAGDIDLDGDVDVRDAALFTRHLGLATGADWATGDFDGDAATTLGDMQLLQSHVGQSVFSPAASAAAVPEPSSWALCAGCILLIVTCVARRRQSRRTGWAACSRFLALTVVVVVGWPARPALAINRFWVNDLGGNFNTPANWSATSGGTSGASLPLAGYEAIFDLPETYNVVFPASAATVASDLVRVDAGTVSFQSSTSGIRTYDLITNESDLTVRGGGRLNIGTVLGPGSVLPVSMNVGDTLSIGAFAGNGTVVVSGNGSRLDAGGTVHNVGASGNDGILAYLDGAAGSIAGTLNLGVFGDPATQGELKILAGADLTVGNLRLGTSASGGTGLVTLANGSTLVQAGAAGLTIGSTSGSAISAFWVLSGGVFSTGTGGVTIGTGHMYVWGEGSTFNANSDVAIDGASGRLDIIGGALNLAADRTITASNGARISFGEATTLSEGTTWNIQSGARLDAFGGLGIGRTSGATTTVIVDGVNSTLQTNGPSYWGSPGNADVTFRNGATADLTDDNLYLSTFNTAGGTSTVRVESGAVMTVDDLHLADAGGATNSATLTIDGQYSNVFQSDDSTLTVGHASDGAATINVTNKAFLSSGNVIIRNTGTINVLGAATFIPYDGNIEIDGGTLNATSGVVAINGDKSLTASNDAELTLGDVPLFGQWTIESGSDLTAASLEMNPYGTVTVDGPGSTVTISGEAFAGLAGGTGKLTVRNGAEATFGSLLLAKSSPGFTTTRVLDIESGGQVSVGAIVLNATGTINLDGGTLNVNGAVTSSGGTFNFLRGALNVVGNLTVGDASGLLAGALTLNTDRNLNVTGTTSIAEFRTLTLDGGSFSTGDLAINGTFEFRRGTLSITGLGGLAIGPAGPLGSAVTVGAGQDVNVSHAAVVQAGASLLLETGGSFNAATLLNNGSLVLAGVNATLGGGVVNNAGVLRGDGHVAAAVNNNAGGEIRAENGKTLLFTAAPGPNAGLINLQGGTLEFAGPLTNAAGGRIAGRGTLKTGGAGLTNDGDIALSSGITDVFGDMNNAAGGRITVSGNADVTFWDDVTSGGALFKVSAGSSATFFGTLAGAGVSGLGDVYAEADVTPGFSPGVASFGGNLTLAETANLLVELAGTTPGAQHDQLAVAGDLSLAGTLAVELLDEFSPSAGNEFVIATAGQFVGQFDTLAFPPLPAGLIWLLEYDPTNVTLSVTSTMLPGDIDLDGDVDHLDAALFTPHLGTATGSIWATGDFDGDNATTLADLNLLQIHLGQSLVPSPVAVPEPASWILGLFGAFALAFAVHRQNPKARRQWRSAYSPAHLTLIFIRRATLLLLSLVLPATAARGLDIALIDVGATPMTAEQLAAFEAGAAMWESTFDDPITVTVNIAFNDLGNPQILGSTMTQLTTHPYKNVRGVLSLDAGTVFEQAAVKTLPGPELTPLPQLSITDLNGTRFDNKITMATANAKALGLAPTPDLNYGSALPNSADGAITFNSQRADDFDYERGDGIAGSKSDFVAVATHEIGHALGFSSATDVQHLNPNYPIHITTLDLWRFSETGGQHYPGPEARWILAGPAEYYDTIVKNVSMSHGMPLTIPTDPECETISGRCQASHWRDNVEALMAPTLGAGVLQDPENFDKHALDYIGYDRNFVVNAKRIDSFIVGWFNHRAGEEIPRFGRTFDRFAPPPDPNTVRPPFNPDFAARNGLDIDAAGLDNRSGIGFVQFEDEHAYSGPHYNGFDNREVGEEQNLLPRRARAGTVPATIMDFYFESDTQGIPFTGRALVSEHGAAFDPTLGRYGGYRVPVALDGPGDGEAGDIDAVVTLLLLADELGKPDPRRQNVFEISIDQSDNVTVVFDARALSSAPPRPGDIDFDGDVDSTDAALFAPHLGTVGLSDWTNGDFNDDDATTLFDLTLLQANLGQATSPSATAVPEPGMLGLLLIGAVAGLRFARRLPSAQTV